MKQKNTFSTTALLPFINVIVIVLIMAIITGGKSLRISNYSTILEQSINVIVAGMGAVFVMSTGSVDFSLGSLACLAGMCASMWAMPYGVISTFLMAAGVGLLSGLFFGTACAKFRVPSFMVGVALQSGYRGFIAFYLASGQIIATPQILALNNMYYKLPIILVLLAVCWYVFEYTRFGKYCKAMGENEQYARVSGINTDKIRMICFMISGVMAGICGVFILARVGGMSVKVGQGLEMRVMLAFVLGGAPISGGFGSKMYKIILGAIAVMVLENGMGIAGISGGLYQVIEAILLVAVITISRILTKRATLRDEIASKQLKAAADAAAASV